MAPAGMTSRRYSQKAADRRWTSPLWSPQPAGPGWAGDDDRYLRAGHAGNLALHGRHDPGERPGVVETAARETRRKPDRAERSVRHVDVRIAQPFVEQALGGSLRGE